MLRSTHGIACQRLYTGIASARDAKYTSFTETFDLVFAASTYGRKPKPLLMLPVLWTVQESEQRTARAPRLSTAVTNIVNCRAQEASRAYPLPEVLVRLKPPLRQPHGRRLSWC